MINRSCLSYWPLQGKCRCIRSPNDMTNFIRIIRPSDKYISPSMLIWEPGIHVVNIFNGQLSIGNQKRSCYSDIFYPRGHPKPKPSSFMIVKKVIYILDFLFTLREKTRLQFESSLLIDIPNLLRSYSLPKVIGMIKFLWHLIGPIREPIPNVVPSKFFVSPSHI